MPRIEIIPHHKATGDLKRIYDDLVKSRGKLAEVHKIQSLNPQSIVDHMDLYMTIMFGNSPLKRVQREMIAVVVSRENGCKYCQQHHLHAVMHYWKNQEKALAFQKDYHSVELEPAEKALCQYAQQLTKNPVISKKQDITLPLKQAGWNDRAILDATMIISYFNFVNRIVLALDVEKEKDTGGYIY
ncbi:MAG: peroxidase-related enzyme [Bacteroidales bacterium]|nr:peroxidase-related enzyme [Bacteroidales bacterium]